MQLIVFYGSYFFLKFSNSFILTFQLMKPDLFDFIEKHNLHDAVSEKVKLYNG